MIEVANLSKSYGARSAVRDVTFRVGKGEIVGFLGPNGAGKSTTLRMLTGFLAPSSGSIRIAGIDALERPIEAKKAIGYMPEACPLYPEMRVREYLRFRAELKRVPSKSIEGNIERALEQASVKEVGDRIIGQLSKGTRQRVGLADALVADPPILVLDEPTAGLDPNQIRQVRDLVRSFAGKKTVLLSTHILPEVESTCDRVVIIHRGKVVSEGSPAELRARSAATGALAIEGSGSRAAFEQALEGIEGVTGIDSIEETGGRVRAVLRVGEDVEVPERVFRAIAAAGLALREMRPTKATSLEDVFEKLTKDEPAEPSPPRDEASTAASASREEASSGEASEEKAEAAGDGDDDDEPRAAAPDRAERDRGGTE